MVPREPVTWPIVRPLSGAEMTRSLTFAEWRLVSVIALAQIVIAGALRVVSLRALRRATAIARPLAHALAHAPDDRVVWATHAAGRRLGRASTCLTRALAACLVAEDAAGLTLTIGVKRTSTAGVEAHAWLTRGDRVLIGLPSEDYAPLVDWAGHPV